MKNLVINGMILTQEKKVGVPRYVNELLNSLDQIETPFDIEVLMPFDVGHQYKRLKKVILNPLGNTQNTRAYRKFWQWILLPMYVAKKGDILLQPAFDYSFFRNDIVIIYDLQPEHFKGNYKQKGRLKVYDLIQSVLRRHAIRDSRRLITISNYVKKDIIHTYHVKADKIGVVYCGWQHFQNVRLDDSVFEVFPQIKKHEYYFSLGSRYRHKNMEWVFAAAEQTPDSMFVVTGYNDVSSYSEKFLMEAPDNVLFTGYLEDCYVKTLMRYCKAFLQPSLSEGFGIPPLEALSVGAQIIVSNATCLPEIYGNTAHYINPLEYKNINLDSILSTKTSNPDKILKKYSWNNAARRLIIIIESLMEPGIVRGKRKELEG